MSDHVNCYCKTGKHHCWHRFKITEVKHEYGGTLDGAPCQKFWPGLEEDTPLSVCCHCGAISHRFMSPNKVIFIPGK